MAHNEFNELRHTATALPPEQMRQLRDELDRKLAAFAARRRRPAIPTPILSWGFGGIMPTRWTRSLPTPTASGGRKSGGNLTFE